MKLETLALAVEHGVATLTLTRGDALNRVGPDHAAALASGLALAAQIAAKSPLAITGIKAVLNHGRDVTIAQGLDHVATWNAGMLQGDDLPAAMAAQREKRSAVFADLGA